MAHISLAEAQAWVEISKLSFLDENGNDNERFSPELAEQNAQLVLSRLRAAFGASLVSTWVDETTTPKLVRTIIAMYYVAAEYDKHYSDEVDDNTNNYATILRRLADQNIAGLVDGSVELEEDPDANSGVGTPVFFPTDASSDNRIGFHTDPSDGGPAFLMGTVF